MGEKSGAPSVNFYLRVSVILLGDWWYIARANLTKSKLEDETRKQAPGLDRTNGGHIARFNYPHHKFAKATVRSNSKLDQKIVHDNV